MQRFCIIFKFSIMPRKPRESSGTGIYHVMLRGINRQDIFDDTEDYWTFIKMMSAVPCYIYAYCLMPNHVHLLIAEKSEPCNDSGYFLTLFRYIHQNPVKAGLVKTAKDYSRIPTPH